MIIVVRAKGVEEAYGDVLVIPIYRPKPSSDALDKLRGLSKNTWDNVVFMSEPAVEYAHMVAPRPFWRRCIAVGPSTASEVGELYGQRCIVPEEYSSMGVIELLRRLGGLTLVLRSKTHTVDEFAVLGDSVVELGLYELEVLQDNVARLGRLINDNESHGLRYAIVVTSPMVAKAICNMLAKAKGAVVVAIGPTTSRELATLNISHVVSREHTIAASIETARKILSEVSGGQ